VSVRESERDREREKAREGERVYVCMCVCSCFCVRKRERECVREHLPELAAKLDRDLRGRHNNPVRKGDRGHVRHAQRQALCALGRQEAVRRQGDAVDLRVHAPFRVGPALLVDDARPAGVARLAVPDWGFGFRYSNDVMLKF